MSFSEMATPPLPKFMTKGTLSPHMSSHPFKNLDCHNAVAPHHLRTAINDVISLFPGDPIVHVFECAPSCTYSRSVTRFPLFALLSKSSLFLGISNPQVCASAGDPVRRRGSEVDCPSALYLPGKEPHHHANVCFVLLVHRIVQDNVHELIKAAQHASDMPVGIQGHCRNMHTITSEICTTSDTTV